MKTLNDYASRVNRRLNEIPAAMPKIIGVGSGSAVSLASLSGSICPLP